MSRAKIEQMIATLEGAGVCFAVDFWLSGWNKSTHRNLPAVTFNVANDEDMDHFEAATVKKGKRCGQRYRAVFFEIGDDEEILTIGQIKSGHFAGPYIDKLNELRLAGYFILPEVVATVGTDKAYQGWLREQLLLAKHRSKRRSPVQSYVGVLSYYPLDAATGPAGTKSGGIVVSKIRRLM